MKIGIMTFHWAANHGAVLQTYSLSNFLGQRYGADVEIINYYPENLELTYANAVRQIRPKAVIQKLREIRKERVIKPFREKLPLTQRYYTVEGLKAISSRYDYIVAGSDQIWNPYFLMYGEKKVTPAYYLSFAGENTKKVSVSASFGCQEFPEECRDIVIPLLKQFSGISVRENTGKEIIKSMDVGEAYVTADPTALMPGEAYFELCSKKSIVKPGSISKFILRKQTFDTNKLIGAICKAYSEEEASDIELLLIPDWLAAIRDSGMVVTNSFHCVMMCLKLHTPFVVVLESGTKAGMNDRFTTLLEIFQLSDRIIRDYQDINKLSSTIDFDKVDEVMERYSKTLKVFIEKNISKNN